MIVNGANDVRPSGNDILCPGLDGLQGKAKRVEFFRSDGRKTDCATCSNLDRCSRESAESGNSLQISSGQTVNRNGDEDDSTFCPAMDELYSKKQVSTQYVRKVRCIYLSSRHDVNERSCQDPKCDSPWCLCNTCVGQIPIGQEKIFSENELLAVLCQVEPGTKLCALHNQEPDAERDFSQYVKKKKTVVVDLPTVEVDDDSLKNNPGDDPEEKKKGKEMENITKKWKEMSKKEKLQAMKDSAAAGKTVAEAAKEHGTSNQTPRNYEAVHGIRFARAVTGKKSGVKKEGAGKKAGTTKAAKKEIGQNIDEMLLAKSSPKVIAKDLSVHISTVFNHKKALIKSGALKEDEKGKTNKMEDVKTKEPTKKAGISTEDSEKLGQILQKVNALYALKAVKKGGRIKIFYKDDDGEKQIATIFTNSKGADLTYEIGEKRLTVEDINKTKKQPE